MFKGLSALFETYSITSETARNADLHPLDVSVAVDSAQKKTADHLREKGYSVLIEDSFKEIFAKNDVHEVTVSFIGLPSSGCRIGVAIYSPSGQRTKKQLVAFMQKIKELFSDFVV